MVFEFRHFIRVLPDSWQSRTVRRIGRRLRTEIQNDFKLMKKLDEVEQKGAIAKVEKLVEKAIKEEASEIGKLLKIGRQAEVLELHETQRLGQLNLEIVRIGKKMGVDKIRPLVDSVNRMIRRIEELEQLQMAKFDKLRSDGDVWVRAMEMDEGSVLNEIMSIGTVEARLVNKIKRLEEQARTLAFRIEKEARPEKMEEEFKRLQKDIEDLGPFIDKEIKYFSEEVKDEIMMMVFLRQSMKKLQERIKKYMQEGFPHAIAEMLMAKSEKVFADELEDMKELVNDYRFAMSEAERDYAKAA